MIGALALGPLLLVAACLPEPPAWVGTGPRVMVFGDSLTYRLEHGVGLDREHRFSHLTDELVASGRSASVAAMIGATTGDLGSVVGRVPAPGADVLLVELGTNDLLPRSDGQPTIPVRTAIRNVRDAVDAVGAGCTVLVTVAETAVWGLDELAPAYNDALRSIRGAVIADWAALVAAEPGYVGDDGIHLTDAGAAAMGSLFLDAIAACGGA